MFVLHLLRGFGTDLGESYINGKLKTGRNITRWSFFEKLKIVAMVIEKPSKSTGIGPIVIIYARSTWLIHTNLHVKNHGNPPCGFQDRPIATGTATKFGLRLCSVL